MALAHEKAEVTDLRGALREAIAHLRSGGVPAHTLAAEVLLMHVLGRDRAWLYAHREAILDAESLTRYLDLVARRVQGVPTQYLTGQQEFWGLEFEVAPGVLIPRPETEHVIEVALDRLRQARQGSRRSLDRPELRIADIGTGSGCLAVALAQQLPEAQLYATDVSARALAIAQRNALRHGVASRIHFVRSTLLDPLVRPQFFDLIVSNPPYVGRSEASLLPCEVREQEPPEALFAGERGSELYQPIAQQASMLLVPGGVLVLELGHNSWPHVGSLLGARSWADVAVTNDLAGIPRVVAARKI